VDEVKDIYNNQTKTVQARSTTNARYPAAARDRSRRAEDLRSDEALVDKPEKNVRAASKAETFVHIPQEMMASGDGNERLAQEGWETKVKEALALCALARTGSQPRTKMG
jgi:hypothetical protein